MRPKLNYRVFARFFWGLASEKEKDHVYGSQESHQMMRRQWEAGSEAPYGEELVDELFERIRPRPSASRKSRRIWRPRLARIAAVVLVFIGLGTVTYLLGFHSQLLEPPVNYVEKSNPGGQRSLIVLPDDSRVWLNAESSLRYPDTFKGQKRRVVKLSGEAYFEVASRGAKAFVVRTSDLSVKVTGTRFNVRAYPEEQHIETTLVEGRVVVDPQCDSKARDLKPGHQASYSRTHHVLEIIPDVNVQEKIAWKNGRLIFNNDPFVEVARDLERWYGVDIHLSPGLKGKHRYTMTITDESLREVCEMLRTTTPLSCTVRNQKVYFSTAGSVKEEKNH